MSFWIIFCLFTTLTTQKIKNLKKGKKPWKYYHFTHVFDKWQNFLSFWSLFHPLTPLTTWKIKILKKWQKTNTNTCRNYHVYHTWKSYDVWFLRYGVQCTECFVILEHFLPFYPNSNTKKKKKKMKKMPGYVSCYINAPNIMIWSKMFLRYKAWQM